MSNHHNQQQDTDAKSDQTITFRKGKQTILRPLEEEDIPRLQKWINDPDVNQYLMPYRPLSRNDEEQWYQSLTDNDSTIMFAIDTLNDRDFIGTMGIHEIRWKDRVATTGALIGEKQYWGKGYGTDAKMTLLHYAFQTLNLRKISTTVLDFNDRSLQYLKKTGHQEIGRRSEEYYVDGEYRDEIYVEVFKEDWISLWEEYTETNSSSSQ